MRKIFVCFGIIGQMLWGVCAVDDEWLSASSFSRAMWIHHFDCLKKKARSSDNADAQALFDFAIQLFQKVPARQLNLDFLNAQMTIDQVYDWSKGAFEAVLAQEYRVPMQQKVKVERHAAHNVFGDMVYRTSCFFDYVPKRPTWHEPIVFPMPLTSCCSLEAQPQYDRIDCNLLLTASTADLHNRLPAVKVGVRKGSFWESTFDKLQIIEERNNNSYGAQIMNVCWQLARVGDFDFLVDVGDCVSLEILELAVTIALTRKTYVSYSASHPWGKIDLDLAHLVPSCRNSARFLCSEGMSYNRKVYDAMPGEQWATSSMIGYYPHRVFNAMWMHMGQWIDVFDMIMRAEAKNAKAQQVMQALISSVRETRQYLSVFGPRVCTQEIQRCYRVISGLDVDFGLLAYEGANYWDMWHSKDNTHKTRWIAALKKIGLQEKELGNPMGAIFFDVMQEQVGIFGGGVMLKAGEIIDSAILNRSICAKLCVEKMQCPALLTEGTKYSDYMD